MKKFFMVHEYSCKANVALLLLRVVAGSAMALHGMGKIQAPFSWMGQDSTVPGLFLFLAAVSEFGGGIAWVLGFLTPLASFGIACTMAVATYFHAIIKGDPFVGMEGSYELASIFLVISILLMSIGPGKYSIDRLIFKKH